MSWGGMVSSMVSTIKNNKALLKNKAKKREIYEKLRESPSSSKIELKFKEVDEARVREYRAKLAEEFRRERMIRRLAFAVFVIIGIVLVLIIVYVL
jgi:pyruvate/2-oxoglutarate dehydrogenase complex dihydrolipoamide acyltransferase (E2) component